MQLFSMEIWIVFQLVIDLLWVVSIVYLLRKLRSVMQPNLSEKAADHVMKLLEPLLKDAEATAKTFEIQIREKNRLIKSLNEKLDARIISMNLLLNRVDAYFANSSGNAALDRTVEGILSEHDPVYDQHQTIFELYLQGNGAETIAEKLSLPKGEIDLVLDLKKKFLKLGQNA